MSSQLISASAHQSAQAGPSTVLEGGPASLAEDGKLKIIHRGGYEHFERDPSTPAAEAVVYRWTGRTEIAE
jgi:hypothetical protein